MAEYNPINYAADVQTPFQAAMQGYGAGAAIRNDQQQQAQQQAALAQQQQRQQILASLAAKGDGATANDYASAMTLIPEYSEHLNRAWTTKNTAQQQAFTSELLRGGAAIKSGQPQVAADLMTQRADAMERAAGGPTPESQSYRTMAKAVVAHPEYVLGQVQAMLGANPSGKDAAETLAKFGGEQRAQELQPGLVAKGAAEATEAGAKAAVAPQTVALANQNVQSQIDERAGRLSLDRDKVTSEYEAKLYELNQKANTLDDGARKLVNDFTLGAVTADQSAGQMLDLAGRLEKSGAASGVDAKTYELLKGLTGKQNAITEIRQEYTRLRNTQAIKSLPPGPATDKDIGLAMKGFPEDTANPATMASFLRGMAKLQQLDAAANGAQAEWVNSVGHMGKPKKDIEVAGIKVPAGTTFVDFSRKFMKGRADERAAEQATQQVQGRGYMRFAQPGAAPGGAPAPGAMGSGTFGVQ